MVDIFGMARFMKSAAADGHALAGEGGILKEAAEAAQRMVSETIGSPRSIARDSFGLEKMMEIGEAYRDRMKMLFELPRKQTGLEGETPFAFSARVLSARESLTGQRPLHFNVLDELTRLDGLNPGLQHMKNLGGKAFVSYDDASLREIASGPLLRRHIPNFAEGAKAMFSGRITDEVIKQAYSKMSSDEPITLMDSLERNGHMDASEIRAVCRESELLRTYLREIFDKEHPI